jgi:hypothetical protein
LKVSINIFGIKLELGAQGKETNQGSDPISGHHTSRGYEVGSLFPWGMGAIGGLDMGLFKPTRVRPLACASPYLATEI